MSEVGQASVNVDENLAIANTAQQTADEANSGITDINDPNKLSPAEKATLKRKYDTDVPIYSMDKQKLSDAGLSTREINNAMSALTAYMTPFFADMTTTDTVNRDTLNTVYSNFDTADKDSDNSFANMVSGAASGAMVAGNNASEAASSAGSQASEAHNSAVAAQDSASSAIEAARSAADDVEVVSSAVTALKDGSTMTVAELESGLQTKISTSDADTLVDTKTDSLAETMVKSSDFTSYKDQTASTIDTLITSADAKSEMIQTIDNASVGFKNADGTSYQIALSADGTALMDVSKLIINGQTSIMDATIGTAQIADAAITNAKIANLDAGKITTGIMDASHINVDQLIANGINGKTVTGITINTPTLNLGLNGTFTEAYDYTQDTSWFLPKKASGTVTFNHGVIEDQGTMQSYVNGTWGAVNDSHVFTSGMTNNVWTEYAPGYYKINMYKQGSTTNVLQRAYADPTGYYYTDAAGNNTYLGNIIQTSQVQTPSLFATVLNQMPGQLRMKMVANGSDWGLQVGSYAGSEAILSDFIYNSTSSNSANLYTTSNGHIVRSTSASKYKYNIKHAIDEDSLADKLLTMHISTWNDKHAVDSYAQTLADNTASEDISIKDNYGLIAEDLRDAGLDMFIEYGKNHTIEGIEYDRAWLPLLPKMRQMNDKINEYELRISKLEAKINE
ncbi:hypothetical protein N6G96_05970 [Pediococcus inopinatus]|uniref:Peptidase S74 domain-containing protein n=1 Tax=Pediococcus inopinatus TaxID=114090 RepID=A0ABZ0Q1N7_9LACO|nr:hypothetical protein [Pediococcus inopinatus]WPC20855.1 hypothetical protein N6G96_05970 [Pediococcus inopinatus]